MVAHASAINTAGVAVVLFPGSLIFRVAGIAIGLRGASDFVARGIVDVFTDFKVELGLRGTGAGGTFSCRVGLADSGYGAGGGLEGLEPAGGVGSDTEVAGKWRADVRWSSFRVNLRSLLALMCVTLAEIPT